jgi:uncharacterized protein YndB with AHSA1/START domain
MAETAGSSFVYVIFIRSTPERVWQALTTSETMRRYWFGSYQDSTWQKGTPWRLVQEDGRVMDEGEVLEIEPLRRIVLRWHNAWNAAFKHEGEARCEIALESVDGAVKLSIAHSIAYPRSKFIEAVGGGWPRILSNLKSLLETGEVAMPTKSACAAA